jgi:hypothetical protein
MSFEIRCALMCSYFRMNITETTTVETEFKKSADLLKALCNGIPQQSSLTHRWKTHRQNYSIIK